jgi:hypothetical protein
MSTEPVESDGFAWRRYDSHQRCGADFAHPSGAQEWLFTEWLGRIVVQS